MPPRSAKKKSSTKKKTPAKSRARSPALQVAEQIWPIERDVLFRPDRLKYVRKLVRPEGCVFCAAAQSAPRFESLCVYQTEHSMVVLNKFPYNSGHVLVLPRRHCGDLLQLSEIEWSDLTKLQRLTAGVINHVYEPGGMNMGLNLGAVGGAGIPDHLHIHVIPRWAGDLNFFPLVAETKVVVEDLATSYDRLSQGFRRAKGEPS